MGDEDRLLVPVGGARVGLIGLAPIFEGLAAAGKTPCPGLGDELVELAGRRNYIPPPARADYARALLAAYRRHLGEEVPGGDGPPAVRILGSGCPNCERLASNVLAVLARLNIAADVEHVRDPAEIGRYGVAGVPALVVNGKVRVRGRVPSETEIEALVREEIGDE